MFFLSEQDNSSRDGTAVGLGVAAPLDVASPADTPRDDRHFRTNRPRRKGIAALREVAQAFCTRPCCFPFSSAGSLASCSEPRMPQRGRNSIQLGLEKLIKRKRQEQGNNKGENKQENEKCSQVAEHCCS